MCRRIINHHMHHDVRLPMVMDPNPSGKPTIYANPRRTLYHRCEISQPLQSQFISNRQTCEYHRTCEYHSCCSPWEEVHYCAEMESAFLEEQDCDMIDDLEEQLAEAHQPEECKRFSLVHYHQQLPYFGDADAYPWSTDPYQYPYYPCGAHGAPATWRDDLTRLPEEYFPKFAHDAKHQSTWEELFFHEAEMLYEAGCDAHNQRAVMDDLTIAASQANHCQSSSPSQCDSGTAVAWDNLLRAKKKLYEQRKIVHDLVRWAIQPCGMC